MVVVFVPIAAGLEHTDEFLEDYSKKIIEEIETKSPVELIDPSELELLSPVTAPCRVRRMLDGVNSVAKAKAPPPAQLIRAGRAGRSSARR